MTAHPSHYALDGVVLGARAAPALAAHLAGCARCARIVAARRAAPAVPTWLEAVEVRPPRPRRWRRVGWFLPLPAVAALGVVLALAYFPRDRAGWTRQKGGPAILLYAKRGEAVSLWDGRETFRPGDRVRLGVRGASAFTQISIASLSPSGEAGVLYAGPLEGGGDTLLPLSLRIEPGGAPEVLSVVLGTRPIRAADHGAATAPNAQAGLWRVRIPLPKEEAK